MDEMIRCLGYKLKKLRWGNMDKTRLAMGSKLGNLSGRGLLNYYYHYYHHYFDSGSCCISQAGLKMTFLLPQPPFL